MFKSINTDKDDAQSLIRESRAWVKNEMEQALGDGSRRGGAPSRIVVEQIGEQARFKATRAAAILARPGASALSQDEIDDLTAIVEEFNAGSNLAATEAHPDSAFAALPLHEKKRITDRVPVRADVADALRARLRGDTRKAEKGIIDPDGSGVNGKGAPK